MYWVLLTAMIWLAACAAAEDGLVRARALLAAGDAAHAVPLFQSWVRLHPGDDAARADLALSLARLHRYKEAVAAIAGVRPPEDPRQRIAFHRLKASIAFGNGDADAAGSEMETAQRLAPRDRELALATAALESLIGDIQEKRGDSLAAVRSYQRATALAPEQEAYPVSLGVELLRHQTFEAALPVFEQAERRFPRSPRIRAALGVTYFLLDRQADAVRTLLETTRLDPAFEPAFQYLGEIEMERPEEPDHPAVDVLCAHAGQDAACGALRLRLAHSSGDANGEAQAARILSDAARRSPENAIARCQLGKALEWAERWREARSETEACARLQPGAPEAHYRLARIYRRLGEAGLARREQRLWAETSKRLAQENDRRAETVQRFVFTLQNQ